MSVMGIIKDNKVQQEYLTFRKVKVGQLFVCMGGNLHQKIECDEAHRITFPDGELYSMHDIYHPVWGPDARVKKILDVTHIEY